MILSREFEYGLETRWQRGQLYAVGTNRRMAMLIAKADFWNEFWAHPLKALWRRFAPFQGANGGKPVGTGIAIR
jgi:hypothetical protein